MKAVDIFDLARLAQRRLPRVIWDALDGGAEDELTLEWNRRAFERWCFRPRVVTGNGTRDLSIDLFGHRLEVPFAIAPTGLNGIYWPGGDVLLARAAAQAGAGFALSTASNTSIEDIAQLPDGVRFFQMYPWGGRELGQRLMQRAQACGYAALIVTVDSLIAGNRLRDSRNNFAHAVRYSPKTIWDGITHPRWLFSTWLRTGMPRLENIVEFLPAGADAHALAAFTRTQRNPHYSWHDIAWLRSQWQGPLLIKGILTEEDARLAADHGADGIVVSNHGGRALDGAPATLDVLPEIVKAAGPLVVLVDGGFRRGADIVKALALGARCVLLGRAALYGLASGGGPGVTRALALLREETDRVMGLLGAASVSQLGPHSIAPAETRSSCKCSINH